MSEAPWTVVFAAEAVNDLVLITDYLTQAYCGFGEPLAEAHGHAKLRIEAIITAAERLATAPLRGESHDDLLPGLRHLALDRAVYWFRRIGFAHALSSGKSRCWQCSLVVKTTSAT